MFVIIYTPRMNTTQGDENEKLSNMSNMFMDLFNYTNTFIMDNFPPNDNVNDILSKLYREREEQELYDYYAEIDDKYETRLIEDTEYYDDYFEDQEQVVENYHSSSDDEAYNDTEGWTTV